MTFYNIVEKIFNPLATGTQGECGIQKPSPKARDLSLKTLSLPLIISTFLTLEASKIWPVRAVSRNLGSLLESSPAHGIT